MSKPKEIFRFNGMQIDYYLDTTDTNDQLSMFKCIIEPNTKMPVPHYHEHFDEIVYGLKGTATHTVNGKTIEVGPSDHLFIRRGDVHAFTNNTQETIEFLCACTPAVFGPDYFRDIAEVLGAGGPPDLAKLKQAMLKHGLVPVVG